ncbi:unannotated protein [freshwater metagenome]|uniref:Unannotated protein n=1 Tax=freshwater metagenome TaxID=449393 RepID=A0A6J6HNB9_9ZZZZ
MLVNFKKFTELERNRKRAILLLRFEASIVFALVIYLLVAPILSSVTAVESLGAEIIFGFLGALGLWMSSNGFKQNKSFGRAPAVLANLIALGVSYYMISGKLFLIGFPLALLALFTIFSSIFGYRE